ncbi:MAG TPA: hypothetical protein VJC39_00310 [Candidatus Nanoarchaeia archaeon]|nr:hypothetical protein [Candidatus Nanoarchaeia archaeon]
MKKAAADIWWVIIAAVIAIVVMMVLLVFFTNTSSKTGKSILECESKNGECYPQPGFPEAKCPDATIKTTFSCPNKEQVCCIGFQQ